MRSPVIERWQGFSLFWKPLERKALWTIILTPTTHWIGTKLLFWGALQGHRQRKARYRVDQEGLEGDQDLGYSRSYSISDFNLSHT